MTWEQRWHPLREEWIIVAAHRQERPWTGHEVRPSPQRRPQHDPGCPLCPRSARSSGEPNPDYRGTHVFDNDHPCVGNPPDEPGPAIGPNRSRAATGVSRVICYTPRHDLSLAELSHQEVVNLLGVWRDQYRELGVRPEVNHVLTFENKGEAVGVSNHHPHCQIYATNFVFEHMARGARACERYHRETGGHLFQDILRAEREDGRRILVENSDAIAFVPYFARYAFEIFVAPCEHHEHLGTLSDQELAALAHGLQESLILLDNLWTMPFPYVMTLHQAPTDGGSWSEFPFHIEIAPPLRKPHLLKHLAGPEIGGGNFVSDTCPEDKAEELRRAHGAHYRTARGHHA